MIVDLEAIRQSVAARMNKLRKDPKFREDSGGANAWAKVSV